MFEMSWLAFVCQCSSRHSEAGEGLPVHTPTSYGSEPSITVIPSGLSKDTNRGYAMASVAVIQHEIETIERRYPRDQFPPENLSMAASCAALVADRTGDASRADVRWHLSQVEPDAYVTATEIARLRKMAR